MRLFKQIIDPYVDSSSLNAKPSTERNENETFAEDTDKESDGGSCDKSGHTSEHSDDAYGHSKRASRSENDTFENDDNDEVGNSSSGRDQEQD